jgi:hypothetical protein
MGNKASFQFLIPEIRAQVPIFCAAKSAVNAYLSARLKLTTDFTDFTDKKLEAVGSRECWSTVRQSFLPQENRENGTISTSVSSVSSC